MGNKRWKKGEFKRAISLGYGGLGVPTQEPRKCTGYISPKGFFAVARAVYGPRWEVTHLPTGLKISDLTRDTLKQCKALVDYIEREPIWGYGKFGRAEAAPGARQCVETALVHERRTENG